MNIRKNIEAQYSYICKQLNLTNFCLVPFIYSVFMQAGDVIAIYADINNTIYVHIMHDVIW